MPVVVQALLIVGLGCGFCLVLLGALVLAGAWWILKPGSQPPSEAIAGPTTVAVARLEPLAHDEGVRGALRQLAREVAAVQEERELQRRPGRHSRGDEPPLGLIAQGFPADATVVLERVEDDPRLHVAFAANFRWLVRPARVFIGLAAHAEDGDLRTERCKGHTFVRDEDDDGPWIGFVGSTFVACDDVRLLRRVVGRLEGYDEDRPRGFPGDLPQAQEGWDVAGVLHGDAADLRATLARLGPSERSGRSGRGRRADVPEPTWPRRWVRGELDRATLAVDWETVDRVRARATVDVVDDLAIEGWLDALDAELAELSRRLEPEGLTLEHELHLGGARIEVELTLEGMRGVLERIARNL